METFKIKHKEVYSGDFYVDAESKVEALSILKDKIKNNEIDTDKMNLVSSEDSVSYIPKD